MKLPVKQDVSNWELAPVAFAGTDHIRGDRSSADRTPGSSGRGHGRSAIGVSPAFQRHPAALRPEQRVCVQLEGIL